jgi:hypothetical protein
LAFFTYLLSNNDAEGCFLPLPMTKDEAIGFGLPHEFRNSAKAKKINIICALRQVRRPSGVAAREP